MNPNRNYDVPFQAESGKALVKSWTRGVLFEEQARQQVLNIASMPFIHEHVAIMPDVHAGIGATVGSVIPTRGAIIPAAVGVDIGCGMMAIRTPLRASDLPDNLAKLRNAIERAVPHGRTSNGGPGDRGAWGTIPLDVKATLEYAPFMQESMVERYKRITDKYPKIKHKSVDRHLGTLGTGNHFVEVCLDEEQHVWVMLHSGSRGPGNAIGSFFISKAREEMQKFYINLPDKDLAYFPENTELFNDYMEAVGWAQEYASKNRDLMALAVMGQMHHYFPEIIQPAMNVLDLAAGYEFAVNCHHNYVAKEHHFGANVYVTRKGAVRARKGDLGIIPGSMGTRSYIVRGLGNPDSFDSCSHGAGRAMSRTQARKQFTVEDHIKATEGVECRKDAEVVDETPAAYKDIDAVMEAQRDLVEVVHTLKQVLCVKG